MVTASSALAGRPARRLFPAVGGVWLSACSGCTAVKRFADLLDRLVLTPSRNGKLTLLKDFFATVPDPERGYALAAITRDLDVKSVKPAMLRALMAGRLGRGAVSLFPTTMSAISPRRSRWSGLRPMTARFALAGEGADNAPSLTKIVETLDASTRREGPAAGRGLARPAGFLRPLCVVEARHGCDAHRRLLAPCQAGARRLRRPACRGDRRTLAWPRRRPIEAFSPGWRGVPKGPSPPPRRLSGR